MLACVGSRNLLTSGSSSSRCLTTSSQKCLFVAVLAHYGCLSRLYHYSDNFLVAHFNGMLLYDQTTFTPYIHTGKLFHTIYCYSFYYLSLCLTFQSQCVIFRFLISYPIGKPSKLTVLICVPACLSVSSNSSCID